MSPKTHNNHKQLFQDENMLDNNSETEYISGNPRKEYISKDTRVLAKYQKGDWVVEAQVQMNDGEWYIASRNRLNNPPENGKEYARYPHRPVESNQSLFTDLSPVVRYILAPFFALYIFICCIRGKDVNLQILGEED